MRRKGRRLSLADQSKSTQALKARQGIGVLAAHPLFVDTAIGHGRIEERALHPWPIEPLTADFPRPHLDRIAQPARPKENRSTSTESRFYLSSARRKAFDDEAKIWLSASKPKGRRGRPRKEEAEFNRNSVSQT